MMLTTFSMAYILTSHRWQFVIAIMAGVLFLSVFLKDIELKIHWSWVVKQALSEKKIFVGPLDSLLMALGNNNVPQLFCGPWREEKQTSFA